MRVLDRLIVTEHKEADGSTTWLLNIDKYNAEDDVLIPAELAEHILSLK